MNNLKFAGLVLAAGYSSRMGDFKPLMKLAGKAAVTHLIETYKSAGIDRIFTVTGHEHEKLAPFIRGSEEVFNPDFAEGMITSIKAGIRAALAYEWDGLLFTPVDHALIRPYAVKLLTDAFHPGAEQVIFPTFNGRRGHPPLISRGIAEKLMELEGPWGAKRFLFSQSDCSLDVEVGSDDMFADMDTPEDYDRMRRLYARTAPNAVECEYMLRAEKTPERAVNHCRAVATRAIGLAEDAIDAGYRIDTKLVFAAAMLHDIRRTDDDHAESGAKVLFENGFPLVGQIIAQHMTLPEVRTQKIDEASIVYLADKETRGDEWISLEQRLAEMPPEKRIYAEPKLKTAMRIRDKIR